MRIDFYCPGNVPFNPKILWSTGLGGAENAIVFLAEALGKMGHRVSVWNDSPSVYKFGEVTYRPIETCDLGAKFDLLVIFRVSVPHRPPNAKHVVFFSCDQSTSGRWRDMYSWLKRFICISPWHRAYITRTYEFDPRILRVCEIGVNIEDYLIPEEKIPGRMIWCSVPHRGLQHVFKAWPLIKAKVPEATLAVTADYTLWGRGDDPGNAKFAKDSQRYEGVLFYGKVERAQLIKLQKQAEIAPYPDVYDECFGIALMECIAAGAVPVSTPIAALETTVGDSGVLLEHEPESPQGQEELIREVVALAQDRGRREKLMHEGMWRAREEYGYETVAYRFLKAALE